MTPRLHALLDRLGATGPLLCAIHCALLPVLIGLLPADATWQVTAIGRENVWPLHRRAAELGGNLRTGLEDTFYLPDGRKARSNGELIDAIVGLARAAGRECATPAEARKMLHLAT